MKPNSFSRRPWHVLRSKSQTIALYLSPLRKRIIGFAMVADGGALGHKASEQPGMRCGARSTSAVNAAAWPGFGPGSLRAVAVMRPTEWRPDAPGEFLDRHIGAASDKLGEQ